MARGESGRCVIEIDPELKKELHSVVARQGKSLKDWFIEKAKDEINTYAQPVLFEKQAVKSKLEKKGIAG